MILSCSNICKSFGENDILKQVSFHIEDHEKAAIVGINGAGKSTLLKVLIGKLNADDGVVTWAKGASIGYLAQHQDLEGRATDGGQYIYVFNLQGEPLCKYTLDRYITGFHVDERNKTITATDVNNDQPIVEFRFG